MKTLNAKTINCSKCEGLNCLANKTLSSGWYGNPKSKVIFYGSSVGGSGETRVIPFASWSGKILDKILKLANTTKEDIYSYQIITWEISKTKWSSLPRISNTMNYSNPYVSPSIHYERNLRQTKIFQQNDRVI